MYVCSPTVSRPCHYRGAGCEQVVHENAHAKKINKVLKTLDAVCNIIRSGAGIMIREMLWWSVEQGGVVAERLDNGYRTILCYRGRVSPCRIRLHGAMSITNTRRPDDRTTGSSKITYTNRHRGFGLFYVCVPTDYVLLFCRRSVSVTAEW